VGISVSMAGGRREKKYITLFQACFVDNCLRNTRVLENVLAEVGVHLKDFVDGFAGSLFRRGIARVGFIATAAVVTFLGFSHGDIVEYWNRGEFEGRRGEWREVERRCGSKFG